MAGQTKSPFSLSIEALEQELIARSAQLPSERLFHFKDEEGTPTREAIMQGVKNKQFLSSPTLNPSLATLETWDLAKILIFKTRPGMDNTRGNASEDVLDYFEISVPQVIYNTQAIAAVCHQDDFQLTSANQFTLKVKNYGKTFNLCELEPFRSQPITTSSMGTAFLIAEDVIATAISVIKDKKLADLRLLFGYAMTDLSSPTLNFSNENIYHPVEILQNQTETEWVLLKLDRQVTMGKKVKLSTTPVFMEQETYVLGHPLGLPVKYAGGSTVTEIETNHFFATLSVYAANPGTPVFDMNSHDVIGMVTHSDAPNFIWAGKGWMSLHSPTNRAISCAKIPISIQ